MRWVIRLNTGNRVTITDSEGNKITLSIAIKEKKVWEMEPDEALKIYLSRMKIDESYRLEEPTKDKRR